MCERLCARTVCLCALIACHVYVTLSLTVDRLYRILIPSASMKAFLPSLMLVIFLRQTSSPLRISVWRCRVSLRCQSRYSASNLGTWPPSTDRRALASACGSGRRRRKKQWERVYWEFIGRSCVSGNLNDSLMSNSSERQRRNESERQKINDGDHH